MSFYSLYDCVYTVKDDVYSFGKEGSLHEYTKAVTKTAHPFSKNKLLIAMSGLNRKTKRDNSYYYEKHSFGLAKNFVDFIKWTGSLMKQILAYVAIVTAKSYFNYF